MALFGRLLNWYYGAPSQAEVDQTQSDIRSLNEQLAAIDAQNGTGPHDQAYLDQANKDLNTTAADLSNIDQQTQDAFDQGAKEGLNNVTSLPGKLVGAAGNAASDTLWGIIKNIPWWVWVALAAYIFISLGGLRLLKKIQFA